MPSIPAPSIYIFSMLLVISSVAKKKQPENQEEKQNKTEGRGSYTYNGGKQAAYQVSTIKCEHK
jgi:hypothetical protein